MRKTIDLTGQVFGQWTVLKKDPDKKKHWICRCKCGIQRSVSSSNLLHNDSRSCRDCYFNSISKITAGQRYGKWLAISKNKNHGWICECECGIRQLVQSSHLLRGAGEGCWSCWAKKAKQECLTGHKFGKWLVLNKDEERSQNLSKLEYWHCKCECGVEKSVYGSHLRQGKSTMCRKCSEHKHKGRVSGRIWGRIRYGAKTRNLNVELGESKDAKKFLYELLYDKQKCVCALSGLPIGIANTIRGDQHGETTASLDRIDSNKNYTRDNVQWVHKWINSMKMNMPEDQFITLCEAVAKYKRGM